MEKTFTSFEGVPPIDIKLVNSASGSCFEKRARPSLKSQLY